MGKLSQKKDVFTFLSNLVAMIIILAHWTFVILLPLMELRIPATILQLIVTMTSSALRTVALMETASTLQKTNIVMMVFLAQMILATLPLDDALTSLMTPVALLQICA